MSKTLRNAMYEAATADLDRLGAMTRRSWRVEPGEEGWQHETAYEFTDGTRAHLTSRYTSDLVVPASPGFELLVFELPAGADPEGFDIPGSIARAAIVGWLVSTDRVEAHVSPITTRELVGGSWHRTFSGIIHPDGRVEWHSPSGKAVLAAVGRGTDCNGNHLPLYAASEAEWIGLVRIGWAAQLSYEEAERRKAASSRSCPRCSCAQAADDDIPF